MMRYLLAVCLALVGPVVVSAEVLRVEVSSRELVLDGRSFGEYGAYEILRGRIVFGLDPANPMNARIVDIGLAPRNANGLVEAWTDFVALKPVGPGSGVALVEVSNRGGKFSPSIFNRASTASLDAGDPDAFGDALTMRLGVTLIWLGWQFDVPEREGVLRLHAPTVRNADGEAVSGLVRSDWTLDEPTNTLLVSHRNHVPYRVADPDDQTNVLTVREGRDAPRAVVPREKWQFAVKIGENVVPDDAHIYMESGFEAGKIYELVYRAENPVLVGFGLAAIRDVMSYAKYDDEAVFPARFGLAAGVSQTGRFLRHFLYQGFNTDEAGRQAYDGLMIMMAGAGRGSFNHRFAQPSRDAHRYSAFFYPTDLFPFSSTVQTDPLTGRSDGLLAHMHDDGHIPKIFQINTGYEYWGRAGSLVHTSPDGVRDVAPHPQERIYHLASGQHFVERNLPTGRQPAMRGNPLDFSGAIRALLVRLVEWVKDDVPPPASAIPLISEGTLVPPDKLLFEVGQAAVLPAVIHVAYRADYGPRWDEGIVDFQPPRLGEPYPSLVSQVDANGNEAAGVRTVELRVPLATYTPWNLRSDAPGGRNELTDFRGTFIPFSKTQDEKTLRGDPRPSIDQLYANKEDYMQKAREAIHTLIDEGFLLQDDSTYTLERAASYWEWMLTD